jgi:phage-related minor tail protein
MSEITNTATIRVVADASGVEAGLRPAVDAARRTGEAVAQVGNGAAAAARNVEAAQRNIIASIQRTTVAMESGGRNTAAYYETMARQRGIDPNTLAPYIAQLRAVEQAQTRTAASAGASAAQIAAAMRTVPAQITDIVTALQGGQAPLTVALQQGGQLRDQFGGAGAAARALGSNLLGMVNPLTVSVAAVAALALAYKSGADEAAAFQRAIILSGNAAGVTSSRLAEMSHNVAAISGSRDAADAVAQLVETAQVPADSIQKFAVVAIGAQQILGRSVKDTVGEFEKLGKSPLQALNAIDEKYHFINASTLRQVKALQDVGDMTRAADVAQQAYAAGVAEQKDKVLATLNSWEKAWLGLKMYASDAANAVVDFAGGREASDFEKINTLLAARSSIEENLERAKKRGLAADVASYQAELDANQRSIDGLREKAKAKNDQAKADAAAQKIDDAQKEWDKQADKYLDREAQQRRDIAAAIRLGTEAHLDSETVEKRVAAIRKSYSDLYNAGIDSNIAALKRRDQVEDLLAQRRVARIATQRNVGDISEEQAINDTAEEELAKIDREIQSRQAELDQIKKKFNSGKDQADKEGEIKALREQRTNREEKQQNDLLELQERRRQSSEALYNAGIVGATAERNSLLEQTKAQFEANQAIGLSTRQVAELQSARLYSAAALKEETAAELDAIKPGNELAKLYREQAQQMRDLADAKVRGAAKQEIFDKPLQDLNAMVDILSALDQAAQSAAQGMTQSFGTVGQAIGGMTTALTGYERTQAAIAAQLANATKDAHGDPTKIQRANQMAAQASAQAQIKSYGDMAGAAKGFFDQNSKGYKVLEGVEKAYRATEMVMAVTNMVKKSGLLGAYTTAVIAGKQAETSATLASVGPEVAAAQIKGQAAAVVGVANQAQGDPYSAWPRMAAMAAVMVGLGFAVSGGRSSVSLAEDRQKTQGTGSVLGDSDAKSESIKRALDAVEKNTYQGLAINYSMLATLRSIDTNIGTFASQLVRTTDITNPGVGPLNSNNGAATKGVQVATFAAIGSYFGPIGAAIGALVGVMAKNIPILGKIATSIFGGKQSVEDSGFGINPASLATIIGDGVKAFQYADIKTSGGWFGSDKHSEQITALGDTANQQFTTIIKSMADSVKSAGDLLGLAGDDFTSRLNSFVVDIGHVSLKDLKGDDLQKALESVFSKLGDDMAQFAVGGLSQLQQVGEGYLETLVRVASEYQTIDVVFQSFGKTFGAVGLASIGARDHLVQLAGGLDKFTSQAEYFLTNFFTPQEQADALKKRIAPTLSKYGLSADGPDASKVFRDFIVGLDMTKEASAEAYTELMTIAPALKTIVDAQKDAADAQVQALEAVKDAASKLLGGVNDSYSVLQRVVTREKAGIQSSIDAHTASVAKLQSLSQALHSTLDSIQSPEQKLFARASARAEIQAGLAITKAGGSLSDAQVESLKKALGAVNQDASKLFGSREDYLFDLLTTQNDVSQLAGITDDSLSVEQKALEVGKDQLKRLDDIVANGQAQIDALNGQSVATLSLAQAMAAFQSSISVAKTNPVVGGTSGVADLYQALLERAPDQAGMQYWQGILAGGTSLDKIRSFFMDSDEYKKLHKIPGFANGGDFAGGIRAVGEVGVEIEATGASRIHSTQAIINALRNPPSNNGVLAEEIKNLREENAKQREVIEGMAKDMATMADVLKGASPGGNFIRVKGL